MIVKTEGYPFLIAVVLLSASLALLLVASLSVPILQTSRIMTLRAEIDGETRSVDFGIWGYCLKSLKSGDNGVYTPLRCTRRMIGWTIQPDVVEFLKISGDWSTVMTKVETSMLVIYPVAVAFTFIGWIFSLAVYFTNRIRTRRTFQSTQHLPFLRSQIALGYLIAFITFFVFLVHVELVSSAQKNVRPRLDSSSSTLQLEWGNSTWLCVVALICLLGEIVVIRSIRKARHRRNKQRLQAQSLPSVEKVSPMEAESHVMVPTGLQHPVAASSL